jgi:hypothetical protein
MERRLNETQLEEMLHAKAGTFRPSRGSPDRLARRALLRAARRTGTVLVLAFVTVPLLFTVTSQLTPNDSNSAFAAFTWPLKSDGPRAANAGSSQPHGHRTRGNEVTPADLKEHARCMRAHGFDIPDPIQTKGEWTILVKEPPADSRGWKIAQFVDCRLMNLTDHMVLGGRTPGEIARLRSCTQAAGFVLPEPTETRPGEFRFDLDETSPAWGSEDWYRVIFATCAPERDLAPQLGDVERVDRPSSHADGQITPAPRPDLEEAPAP